MNGIAILAVYAAIMITITLLFTKRGTSAENFHVGKRNMGVISSAMSIAATWIWAPALFTSAEKAYTNGIAGLFWFLVPNVLCLIFFIPFAKAVRERMPDGITLSGFMGQTYKSRAVRRVYLFQLSSLTILSTAVQLLAGGRILSSATGINFTVLTILLALTAFAYSQFSGIRASILTDVIQMVFILAACLIFVPWALRMPGGADSLLNGLGGVSGNYRHLFDKNGIEVLLAFGLPTAIGLISGPFGDQCFWQRAFCIDRRKIGRAFLLGALLFGIVPLGMGILGFIAAGSGTQINNTGIVNFELIRQLFPAWVTIPFLYMLVSGLLSTVDSNLCAAASLTTDLEAVKAMDDRSQMKVSRGTMIALLITGILIANIPGLTVTHMFLFYGTLRATTLLPTVFTLCGMKLRPAGVVAGVTTALVAGLPVFGYATINNLSILKTAASAATVLISGALAMLLSVGYKKETN